MHTDTVTDNTVSQHGTCILNLITWASMLISALLKVPLGALREQQQAAREHFGTTENAQQHGGVAAVLTWRKPID